MLKGRYIVFEGVVGTGKTTQSKRFTESLQVHFPEREINLNH
jgi:thymidylate kinase